MRPIVLNRVLWNAERKQTDHPQRVHASKSQKALAPLDQTPESQHSVFAWSRVGILSHNHHDCSCGYSNCISKPVKAYDVTHIM